MDLQKSYIYQFYANTGCRLEELPRGMTNKQPCEFLLLYVCMLILAVLWSK